MRDIRGKEYRSRRECLCYTDNPTGNHINKLPNHRLQLHTHIQLMYVVINRTATSLCTCTGYHNLVWAVPRGVDVSADMNLCSFA